MSHVEIKFPVAFQRGGVLEAATASPIDSLTPDFAACWNNVLSQCKAIAPQEVISVLVEIWPDTGRLIWICRGEREIFRFELRIDSLEIAYFQILRTPDFENRYQSLFDSVQAQLQQGLDGPLAGVAQIVVRDSDDAATEVKWELSQ